MRPLGINLHAVKGLTDDGYLKKIAALGFTRTFTGVHSEERQKSIAALCETYGIVCETLHAPFSHINDIWLPDDNGLLSELFTCIDRCLIAGAKIAVVHLSSGQNPPPITDIGRERFARLVDYASAKNVKVAFENQRMLANLAWALETFPPDVAGFCWDCGHESCFTPGRHYMPLFSDRLICTHLHDNSGVFNADNHRLPFDGAIAWESVADAIRTSGYEGSLMLETGNTAPNGTGGFYDDLTPEEYLEKAWVAAEHLRAMTDGKPLSHGNETI
ncbi:MAG: sugar phosphate isomerase/epimerase [Clostridia bacterium]|nr:sugar phosphate isomerase/epimerase [Clostridia bacterium]